MKTTNKLKWEAIVSNSASGWAIVNPVTGQGDTKVSIDIKNSDVYASPDTLSGEVTFRCTNCELLDEDEKIKTIQVCRCACDCSLIEIYRIIPETIEESGWKKEKPIGSYQVNTRCNPKAVSAVLVNNRNGNTTNLNCADDGYIYLVEDIPYNQDWQNPNSFTVYVYFDKGNLPEKTSAMEDWMNPCSHFSFSQAKLECDCSAIKTPLGEVSLSKYFAEQLVIPQSGLADGTQLFTYTIKQYCPHAPQLSAKITFQGGSRNIEISSFNGTTGQGILRDGGLPAYTGGGTRNIKIWIYYNGEECLTATTTQRGCDCDNAINKSSFSAVTCLSVFGVEPEEEIGTYSMNSADNNCPNKISGTLTGGGITYPLSFANGKIKLGGSTAIPPNLDSKNEKTFHAEIFYDNSSTSCVDYNMTQKGYDCDCHDVRFSLDYDTTNILIPQTGITASTTSPAKIGIFSLLNTKCKDCPRCFKIIGEEIDPSTGSKINDLNVGIKTDAGTNPKSGIIEIYESISDNDAVAHRKFKFTVWYNKANIDDDCAHKPSGEEIWSNDCDSMYFEQAGKECNCNDNVKVTSLYTNDFCPLPMSGSHDKLVVLGEGTCAMRATNPDEHGYHKLLATCGSLVGFSATDRFFDGNISEAELEEIGGYIESSGDFAGNRIVTQPIKLTQQEIIELGIDPSEEPQNRYKFRFLGKVKPQQGELDITAMGNIYFKNKASDKYEPCTNVDFGAILSPKNCDCYVEPNITPGIIPCDGAISQKVVLAEIKGVNKDMAIEVMPAEGFEEIVTNLETAATPSELSYERNVKISGNVTENFGDQERIVKILIKRICNPGTAAELICDEHFIEVPITQKKCFCDCSEITANTKFYDDNYSGSYYESYKIDIPYSADVFTMTCASYVGDVSSCIVPMFKCQDLDSLSSCDDCLNDDNGVTYCKKFTRKYSDNPEDTRNWFTAEMIKETSGRNVLCKIKIIVENHKKTKDSQGQPIEGASYTVKIAFGHIIKHEGSEDTFESCKELDKTIDDEICDCDLYNKLDNYKGDYWNPEPYTGGKIFPSENNPLVIPVTSTPPTSTFDFFVTNGYYGDETYYLCCLEVLIVDPTKEQGQEGWLTPTYTHYVGDKAIYKATMTWPDGGWGGHDYPCYDFNYSDGHGGSSVKIEILDEQAFLANLPQPPGYYSLQFAACYVVRDEYGNRITGTSQYNYLGVEVCGIDTLIFKMDSCDCSKISNYYCNHEYTVTIDKNSDYDSETIIWSSAQDCIYFYLEYGGTTYYSHEQGTFDVLINQEALFNVKLYKNSVYVKLKSGKTLSSKYYFSLTNPQEGKGEYLGEFGFYYLNGTTPVKCNDCKPTLVIEQKFCECSDIHDLITATTYSVPVNQSTQNVDVNIIEYPGCGKVQLYLLCNEKPGECECTHTAEEDINGDGHYDSSDDSICIFKNKNDYPSKYDYVDSMPSCTDSYPLTIHINSPYKNEDGLGYRETKFIGFWVDENCDFIHVGDGYCGKEFSIVENYGIDCSQFDCKIFNLAHYSGGTNMQYDSATDRYIILPRPSINTIWFNLPEAYYDNCFKLTAITQVDNYYEITYTTEDNGNGTVKVVMNISIERKLQNEDQSISFDVSILVRDENTGNFRPCTDGITVHYKTRLEKVNN